MNSLPANNLMYQQYDMKTSRYKMYSQPAQSAGDVTITSGGGQKITFELSGGLTYNMSRCKFEAILTPNAGGTGFFNYVHTDGFTIINTMVLRTRNGVEICRIDDVAHYTNMLIRRRLSFDKARTLESTSDFNEGACIGTKYSNESFLLPNNNTALNDMSQLAYLWPDEGTENTATPIVRLYYDFSLLFDTFFAEDKSVFFGNDVIYLDITLHPTSLFIFKGTTAGDEPNTGDAPFTGSATLSNIKLWLAQDVDLETTNMLASKAMSAEGLKVLIKKPIYNKISTTATTAQNINVKYNSALGKRLLKIYHALYNATENGNTAFDHINSADAKCSTFYINIDNLRTTDGNLDTSNYEDYKMFKDLYRGSCINSSDDYYYNWVVETNLSGPFSTSELNDHNPSFDNINMGKDLTKEIKYDAIMTTPANVHNHYIYGIVTSDLLINSAGISIIN